MLLTDEASPDSSHMSDTSENTLQPILQRVTEHERHCRDQDMRIAELAAQVAELKAQRWGGWSELQASTARGCDNQNTG